MRGGVWRRERQMLRKNEGTGLAVWRHEPCGCNAGARVQHHRSNSCSQRAVLQRWTDTQKGW